MPTAVARELVVLKLSTVRCRQACILKEAIRSLLVCVLNALAVQALGHVDGRFCLAAVQDCKGFIAKFTQDRAPGNPRRAAISKELAALREAGGMGEGERRRIEVTTGQGGNCQEKRQRGYKRWAGCGNFHCSQIQKGRSFDHFLSANKLIHLPSDVMMRNSPFHHVVLLF